MVAAAAAAGPIKDSGKTEPATDARRNSLADDSFMVERPSWSAPAGLPQFSFEGISIDDTRFRGRWKQPAGHMGKLNFTKRYPQSLSFRPDPGRLDLAVAPAVNAVQQVPDSGGSVALLGLSILGMGTASRILRKLS